jgi:hypothetical protein
MPDDGDRNNSMTSWSTVITLKLAAAQPIKKFLYLV